MRENSFHHGVERCECVLHKKTARTILSPNLFEVPAARLTVVAVVPSRLRSAMIV